MGLLDDLGAWLDQKKRNVAANAQNLPGLLASFAQDVQRGAAAGKSAWDASRSVMPGVREAGIREMNAQGQELGGLLGTFAGVGAKTADVAKLGKAKEMVKAGADPVEVWKQTGWTDQFPDGKWRFEISDDKATKKQHYFTPKQAYAEARTNAFIEGDPEALKRVQAMAPYSDKTTKELVNEYSKTGKAISDAALGGDMERAIALNDARSGLSGLLSQMHQRPYGPASAYVRHPDLRAAYPDVATMHTRTYADDLGDANAAYLRKDGGRGEQIAYHAGAPDKSTFLHESQHAIQQREGFARGGNPADAADWPEVQQLALKLSKEMEAARAAGDKQTYSKLYDKVYRLVGQDGYEAYKSLAGEAEARLTQSRMNLTPAERAARPPWLEFDVPREEQIVRGLLGEPTGPAMSVREPTKFQLAHAEAQRNAALPVEQGGLGLGPQNTAMERAKAMGFEGGWAHGTGAGDIAELRPGAIGAEGPGIYATKHLPEASTYAQGDAPTVYPLMVKRAGILDVGKKNPYDVLGAETDEQLLTALKKTGKDSIVKTQDKTPDWLIKAGAPAMPDRQHYVSMNPANFRSRFAAFDPKKKDSRDLLASMGLLGLLGAGAYGQEQ